MTAKTASPRPPRALARLRAKLLAGLGAALLACAVPPPIPAKEGGSQPPPPAGRMLRGRVLTPSGKTFDVEVVADPLSRERGLKARSSVPAGTGMLFVFPEPARHRFWMFECLTPIDILWMDAERRVVHIEAKVPICPRQPCPSYGPDADVLYVLEIGPGVAAQDKIKIGDRLTLLFADAPKPT